MFKTPKFWHKRNSLISMLLVPVSWVYHTAHKLNMIHQGSSYQSQIPVICVGNAIAGGSGKTPSVIALVKIIIENNLAKNPVILTRGYGGNIGPPTYVDLDLHNTKQVGDEALLLAKHAPTIVAKNRAEGAKLAEKHNANLIIMDDGLQNNQLHKDISFLVIDRQIDFGNNRLLPAGPLREPLSVVLNKVQAVVCIGPSFHSDLPVFEAAIHANKKIDKTQKYVAFAGLGYPEKFKNTLLDFNIELVGWHGFPDHHHYTIQELDDLRDEAMNKEAQLITTEKDYVRLPKDIQDEILTLPISLNFENQKVVTDFIKEKLGHA